MTNETKKPIIAVDIDEVLTPFVPHLLDFYNAKFPENQIVRLPLLAHIGCRNLRIFTRTSFGKVWCIKFV
jgi:5'(3')-deoxyribonucleotidase